MSRTIRQTALSGLLGSKRFIVAVCAAIAMVLGAMSVGASIFVPSASSEQQAANSPVFTERKHGSNASSSSREDGGVFTKQHTLVPNVIPSKQTQTPANQNTNTVPKVKAGLSIEFGPVNANAGINLGGLQVKVESSLAPTIEPLATPPVVEEPPVEPPAAETPKEETPPEEPTPPPAEEPSPLSASANIRSTTSPADPVQ